MTGMNAAYPYRAPNPRWIDWNKVSTWCDQTLGKQGQWEYFNSEFCFQREQDMMMFKLKWLV